MFWTVQRGTASGVVSTGIVISPAADRSVVAIRLGLEPEGSEERTASTAPAIRTAITSVAITQVVCRRVILGIRVPRLGRFGPPPPFRKRSRRTGRALIARADSLEECTLIQAVIDVRASAPFHLLSESSVHELEAAA
jgi:hypothetical protein